LQGVIGGGRLVVRPSVVGDGVVEEVAVDRFPGGVSEEGEGCIGEWVGAETDWVAGYIYGGGASRCMGGGKVDLSADAVAVVDF